MGRRIASTLGMVVMLLALTGCSVRSHGWVGILRGDDGSLSAVVQMCEESVDGVTFYTVSGPGEKTIARAEFDIPATDSGVIEIATLEDLDVHATYHLYGWTHTNTSSAAGPDFTRDGIDGLEPGNVLATDLDPGEYTVREFTQETFEAMVLDHCDE